MSFNLSFVTRSADAIGTAVTTVAKATESAFVVAGGLTDRAHMHVETKNLEAKQHHAELKATSEADHKARLISRLSESKNRMVTAKELAMGANVNESIHQTIAAKAQALTTEQLLELAKSGKDITDPVVLRKELLGSSTDTDDTSDNESGGSLLDRMMEEANQTND